MILRCQNHIKSLKCPFPSGTTPVGRFPVAGRPGRVFPSMLDVRRRVDTGAGSGAGGERRRAVRRRGDGTVARRRVEVVGAE